MIIKSGIKLSRDLDIGRYNFVIENAEDTNVPDGRKVFRVTNRVIDGPSEGLLHTETYWIGTEGDPEADDPQTQDASVGLGFFLRFVNKLGFETANGFDTAQLMPALVGCKHTTAIVAQKRDPNRRQFGRTWPLGAVPAGIDGPAEAPRPTAKAPTLTKPGNGVGIERTVPAVTRRTVPTPVRPAAPAPKNVALAPGIELEEE